VSSELLDFFDVDYHIKQSFHVPWLDKNKQTNKKPEILFKVTHTIGIYGTRVAEGFKVKSSLYFYSALYNTNCFNASIVLYTIQIVSMLL